MKLLPSLMTLVMGVLLFVTPGPAAGTETVPTLQPSPSGSSVRVTADDNSLSVSAGARAVFTYRFGNTTYKPYVEQLCTPSGRNILRDSPHDHVHHHALMLALSIDGCDFWSERSEQANGTQRTDSVTGKVSQRTDGADAGRIDSRITWVKTDGKPVVVEDRRITAVCPDAAEATLLTWRSVLSPANGVDAASITGSHYFGLGMRFLESMDKDGRFFFGEAKPSTTVRGDERVTLCRWAAYSAKLDGKPVTVAIFGHPKNPRPLYAFTMGDKSAHFAYLAGTLNVYRQPLQIKAGSPMTLCWGVAVFDGTADTEAIEKQQAKWLEMTGE